MLENLIKAFNEALQETKLLYVAAYLKNRGSISQEDIYAISILIGIKEGLDENSNLGMRDVIQSKKLQNRFRYHRNKDISRAFIKLFHQPRYIERIQHYENNIKSFSDKASLYDCWRLALRK